MLRWNNWKHNYEYWTVTVVDPVFLFFFLIIMKDIRKLQRNRLHYMHIMLHYRMRLPIVGNTVQLRGYFVHIWVKGEKLSTVFTTQMGHWQGWASLSKLSSHFSLSRHRFKNLWFYFHKLCCWCLFWHYWCLNVLTHEPPSFHLGNIVVHHVEDSAR